MAHAELLLASFEALTPEERPPRWCWHMPSVFSEFVDEAFEERRNRTGGGGGSEDEEMYEAPEHLTPEMRRAMRVGGASSGRGGRS